MKVLILGADGMIGHKMAQTFAENSIDLVLNSRDKGKFLEEIFPKTDIFKYDFNKEKIEQLLNNVNP